MNTAVLDEVTGRIWFTSSFRLKIGLSALMEHPE